MKAILCKPILTQKLLTYHTSVVKLEKDKDDEFSTLKSMYHLLGCRCIDCATVTLQDKVFDVWFDDEFIYSQQPLLPNVLTDRQQLILGNVLIAKADKEGVTIGLEDGEIEMVAEWLLDNHSQAIKHYNAIVKKMTA